MLSGLVFLVLACPAPESTVDAGPEADDAGSGGDAGPTGDGFDVASFCAAFHGAACAGFTSCGCALDGRAFDDESCTPARTAACEQALAPAVPLIASGALVVDTPTADACLRALAALVDRCDVIDASTLPASCAAFLLDDAALGEPCALSSIPTLCADGAGLCDGACVALPAEDEPCAGGLFCARGLTCDAPFSDDGVCTTDVDEPVLLGEGASCTTAASCALGLACIDGVCSAGPARGAACGGPVCSHGDACVRDFDERVCGARAALGAPCAVSDEAACDDGLYCDVDLCAPLPLENEACGPALECAPPFLCDVDNGLLCVLPPSEGEPCLVGSALCALGLGCNVDNVCAVGPGEGEPCLFPNNLCADGLACDFTFDGSFCAARRGAGGACQNDVVCDDGLFCGDEGVCTATFATGTPCPTGGGCSEGDQCNDLGAAQGAAFTCQPVPDAVDEPCLDECAAGLACTGPGGSCAPAICASP